MVCLPKAKKSPLNFLPVFINNSESINALVDTGCTTTCIEKNLAPALELPVQPPPSTRISGAFTNSSASITGTTTLNLSFTDKLGMKLPVQIHALVVEDLSHQIFLVMDVLSGDHVKKITNRALHVKWDKPHVLPFCAKSINMITISQDREMEEEENFIFEICAVKWHEMRSQDPDSDSESDSDSEGIPDLEEDSDTDDSDGDEEESHMGPTGLSDSDEIIPDESMSVQPPTLSALLNAP